MAGFPPNEDIELYEVSFSFKGFNGFHQFFVVFKHFTVSF